MGEAASQLRERAERERDELGRDLEQIGDRVSPKRMAERRTESIRSGFQSARERVMGTAEQVTGSVSDTMSSGTDAVRSTTTGNPLVAGMVAFGGGLLLAAAFPSTRSEQQVAQRLEPQLSTAADEARNIARDTGQHIGSEVREAASEVAEDAREAASRAREGVKEQSRSR